MPINTLFKEPTIGIFSGGEEFTTSDQITVWDAEKGYFNYYFGDWSGGGALDPDWDRLWYSYTGNASLDGEPTLDTIDPGSALWFIHKGSSINNFALVGQVSEEDFYFLDVKAGATMFSSPYPEPMPFNETSKLKAFDWSGAFGGEEFTTADQITVWDAEEGYFNYYFGDWSGGSVLDPDWDRLWYSYSGNASLDGEPTLDALKPGAAAWYIRKTGQSPVTFTLYKPF